MSEQDIEEPVEDVPTLAEDDENWQPEGYAPGPDDPGPVETECGPEDENA